MVRRGAAVGLLLVCLATGAGADEQPAPAAGESAHPRWLTRRIYADDGLFVHGPATAVGMTGFILFGSAATAVCAPFDLLRGLTVPETFGAVGEACGTLVGESAGNLAYAFAGAPFWAVKQVTWDGPRALLRRTTDPAAS